MKKNLPVDRDPVLDQFQKCLRDLFRKANCKMLINPLHSIYYKRQECIPVGCVLPAAGAITGGLHPPWSRHPPRSRHSPPEQAGPPRCGPVDPPYQIPSTSPLGVDLGPPLETCCKACWDTTCNACWDTTPPPWTDTHL